MILISGYMRTDPAEVRRLVDRLRSGIPATMLEDGCLFYDFGIADEAAGIIIALERWRDQASLDKHLETPAIAALVKDWDGKFTIDVTKHDLSNERGFLD
jgi:quinol monooxygenase YgiN